MSVAESQPRESLLGTFGWAFYLASSWTWVIGMYLPVLLVRDYGFAGWLAFAIPNVLGAAAMGWILRSREQALRIIEQHTGEILLFSTVTVSFQVFALLWLLPRLVGIGGMLLVMIALACAMILPVARGFGTRLNATAAWFISAAVFAMLAVSGVLEMPQAGGARPAWHLAGLVPACVLGFVLCPYLDVTFLHARSRTEARKARVAFSVGFGVFFLVMILFTLLYALPLLEGRLQGAVAWLLAAHLTLQVCFTVAAHTSITRIAPVNLIAIVTAATLGLVALAGELRGWNIRGMDFGELVYRGFMAFYGLFFPAYVLLVMLGRAPMRTYWVACALALPFFVLGFGVGWMRWTAVGVAIILAAGAYALMRKRISAAAPS